MHISIHRDNDVASRDSKHPSDLVTRRFLDPRLQYESLEGLVDFLAFLIQKLWPNVWVLIKEMP